MAAQISGSKVFRFHILTYDDAQYLDKEHYNDNGLLSNLV